MTKPHGNALQLKVTTKHKSHIHWIILISILCQITTNKKIKILKYQAAVGIHEIENKECHSCRGNSTQWENQNTGVHSYAIKWIFSIVPRTSDSAIIQHLTRWCVNCEQITNALFNFNGNTCEALNAKRERFRFGIR